MNIHHGVDRMNDTIYETILVHYIPHHIRPICCKKDIWLVPIRRIHKDIPFCSLLVDIVLHAGTPCLRRYCICLYFSQKDKADFLRDKCNFYMYKND